MTRISGELTAAGFRVVVAKRRGQNAREALESAVASSNAAAGIAIERDDDRARAEVWVSDTLTGKLSMRPLAHGESPAILAVRAVELLRASLLELDAGVLDASERRPIEKLQSKPDPSNDLRSLRAPFGFEGAFVVAYHPELDEASFAPALRAFLTSDYGVGGRLSVVAPMLGASPEGELGIAKLSTELFLAELVYTPPISPWFGLTGALGLGGMHLHAEGDLIEPARGRADDLGAFVLVPSLGLAAKVGDFVSLTAEFGTAFVVPTLKIDMGSERLGVVGRPMLLASHGVSIAF